VLKSKNRVGLFCPNKAKQFLQELDDFDEIGWSLRRTKRDIIDPIKCLCTTKKRFAMFEILSAQNLQQAVG